MLKNRVYTTVILIGFMMSVNLGFGQTTDGVLIDYQAVPPSRSSSALLELRSTDQGVVIPKVALTATGTYAPITGAQVTSLMVYNTNTAGDVTPGYYYWDGSWKRLLSSNAITSTAWLQSGNAGTTASTAAIGSAASNNFIGTTDAQALVMATNGFERIRIASDGNMGIGITSPTANFHIKTAGNTLIPMRLDVPGEAYSMGSSSRFAYYNAGTVMALAGTANSVNSGALIDFNAYNGNNGATGVFIGAVAGATDNGPANFVVGRRTGGTSWAESMRVDVGGKVGIGTTAPHERLHIDNGSILAGSAPATDGSLILAGNYSGANNYLNTFGSQYSSGGTVMGYGIKPKSGSAGYASSTSIAIARSASLFDSNISFLTAATQTVAAGTDVAMTPRMIITNAGLINIPDLTASSGVYTDASKNLTSTPPNNGIIGYWTRDDANNRLYNTATGDNVGIGTTAPASLLTLKHGGNIEFETPVSTTGIASIQRSGGKINFVKLGNNSDYLSFETHNAGVNVGERMRITETGNVGIGTTSPARVLEINDPNSTAAFLRIVGSEPLGGDAGIEFSHPGTPGTNVTKTAIISETKNTWKRTDLRFVLNNDENDNNYNMTNDTRMIIKSDGNVGIGTTTPNSSALLDVSATDKGILIPRINIADLATAAPVNTPATSLLVYNTNTTTGVGYYHWDGTKWVKFVTGNTWRRFLDDQVSNSVDDRIYHKGQVVLGFDKAGAFDGLLETDFDATANAKLWVAGDIAIGDVPDIDPAGTSKSILWKGWRNYWNGDKIAAKLMGKYVPTLGCGDGRTVDLQFYIDPGTRDCTNEIDDPASEQLVMHLDHDGKVGIGTDDPTQKLDVSGAGLFRNGNSSTAFTNDQLLFGYSGTANYQHAIKSRHHSGALAENALDFFVWKYGTDASTAVGTQQVMTLAGTGNVGIGTTAPADKLSIRNGALSFTLPTSDVPYVGLDYDATTDALRLRGNISSTALNSTYMTVLRTSGNVGIGMTPVTKLDVSGAIRASSGVRGDQTAIGGYWSGIANQVESAPNNPLLFGTVASGSPVTRMGLLVHSTDAVLVLYPSATGNWARLGTNSSSLAILTQGSDATSTSPTIFAGNNGRVGIGTYSPGYPLQVNGSTSWTGNCRWYDHSYGPAWSGWGPGTANVAIYANQSIMTDTYFVSASDQRIKKNLSISDSKKDLELLNEVQITDYLLIDSIENGNRPFKKVIAQQVEEVYPLAVSKVQGFVPTIYAAAKNSEQSGNRLTLTMESAHQLSTGDLVRMYNDKGNKMEEIATVVDDYTFSVKTEETAGKRYFVYGKQVDDFRTVDYDALGMLNISATQELSRIVDQLKSENEVLKDQAQTSTRNLNSLKAEVETLKQLISVYGMK